MVITALRKDGWLIVTEQVTLHIGKRRLWIDLRVRHEERNIILVEAKSYENVDSPVNFLQHTLGQYLMYRAILENDRHPEPLYLAVPEQAYIEIIQTPIGQLMVEKYKINLIVYDVDNEVIIEWMNNS